ncbi:class I SAM-dependent methyltransferase [Brevibacillus sp. SYSU BS000544]|uniref:class I SAM-dependent methyltransferase n=1 Tax=Brevibacillus sp. SYSU BS000544 TaxID=3416443 RepID=UPI003CE591EE
MRDQLSAIICDDIEQTDERAIPFARFMELALYHPTYGYYTKEKHKVGKEGDFYTSATVHPVFSETLADAICQYWDECRPQVPTLVEVGGGTGYMIKHMVAQIRASRPDWYEKLRIILVEASPYHRELQAEAILDFAGSKTWYSSIEEAAQNEEIEGVIVSNEYFDAFPVHIVERDKNGWYEIGVAVDGDHFVEKHLQRVTPEVEAFLQEADVQVRGKMRIEVNLGMKQAVASMAKILRKGHILTIDYGDLQKDLYHPNRNRGTLMCYYKHQAHENPFIHVGEQDITAHVNFSSLMKWGEEAGVETVSFQRQDEFLIQHGILHKAESHNDRDPFTSQAMKRNRAIQQLIMPSGMGGVFRILLQKRL